MDVANVSASQLEYLLAVLGHDTWREAAAASGVSPSALSQGIAELERRLGVELFERDGRRRRPTAAAAEASRHATRILAEMREFGRWAETIRGGASGQISIGMIDTAAIHHFGDALVAFRAEHPDLDVRLTVQPSNDLVALLEAGSVDIVVAVDPEIDDRFVARPLVEEPLHVYAPPGVAAGRPHRWGPWVGFPRDSRTRALTARSLRAIGASYDIVAESSQPAVLREMVQLGMGWCVLPALDAESEPHALTRARRQPIATRTLTLVERRDRVALPALDTLISRIADHVAGSLTSP